MKALMLIVLCSVLGGCCVGDEQCDRIDNRKVLIAETEIELMGDCMRLAATIERVGDDDVSDIISECRSHSHHLAIMLAAGQ